MKIISTKFSELKVIKSKKEMQQQQFSTDSSNLKNKIAKDLN